MNYYDKDISEIYKEFDSSSHGLKQDQIDNKLQKYGYNKLVEGKKKSKLSKFLNQFNDMMIIILLIVMLLTFFYALFSTHDYTDSIVIFVVVILNAIMGFIQEEKAEVTLDGLKKYSATSCTVKRNGEETTISTEYLVPGDIIILNPGDKVPADARIIEAYNLQVDESPLTGESAPVRKNIDKLKGKLLLQEQTNMIFSGTNITDGKCIAIVCKTGMKTEIGSIAVSLNTPYEVKTPLQVKIEELSKKITFIVLIIICIVFLYSMINNYSLIESISLCIALAVGAIPEGLPAVITITLSIGVGNLAKKKTVVKQMNAIETLGSTDIICSDKTGTITQNKMIVEKDIIYNQEMVNLICALDNEGVIDKDKYIGDPTETCLYDYLKKQKIDPIKIRKSNKRLFEIPFDSKRKMSSSINEVNNKKYIFTKGSVENLIEVCNRIDDGKVSKLTSEKKKEITNLDKDMARDALRVLGFAYKELDKINEKAISSEEKDLIFVGLVGIIDPARPDAEEAVKKCISAGIKPIMITGDSLSTATAIAKQIGIVNSEKEGVLGSELDKYTDEQLIDFVTHYSVYARVNPNHKRRIIAAFQSAGKVVAMTGDGVNDAPAIKDAHVGVGMGITGTDVTKSVADIIILDDSFSTIVTAVEEGRRIFSNIRNNIVYALSSNFAEIFSVFIGMLTGNTILLPIQILFIDLVTDSIPSICLSFEKSEKGIMDKPPRGINKTIFTPFIIFCIASSSIIETLFVLYTYFVIGHGLSSEQCITLALLAMVMQEIVYAVSTRNLKDLIIYQGLFSNKAMNIGLLAIILVELIVFLTPVGSFVGVVAIESSILIKAIIVNLFAFFIYEVIKPIARKVFND